MKYDDLKKYLNNCNRTKYKKQKLKEQLENLAHLNVQGLQSKFSSQAYKTSNNSNKNPWDLDLGQFKMFSQNVVNL